MDRLSIEPLSVMGCPPRASQVGEMGQRHGGISGHRDSLVRFKVPRRSHSWKHSLAHRNGAQAGPSPSKGSLSVFHQISVNRSTGSSSSSKRAGEVPHM